MTNINTLTRPEIEKIAARKILMARTAIIQTRKFYGVLVANVRPQPCWSIPTMGTDSKTHFYNPAFIARLDQKKVEGTQVHESEHDARHHSTRRNGRDPELWNRACDYTINGDIIAQGFVLPDEGDLDGGNILYRKDLIGLAAEDIYRILVVEREQERQKQQPQQPEDEDGEAEDEDNTDTDDTDQDDDASDDGKSNDDGDDGDDESEAESGDGDESEDDASDDGDSEDGDGDGEPEGDDEGQGGDGESDDAEGDGEADGEGQGGADGETEGDGEGSEGKGKPMPTSCGDGGCGEVFDAPGDAAERADTDAKWTVITHQAAAIAAKAGDVPGHWQGIFEKRKTVTQDWRERLRAFFDAGASVIQTWKRPSRRFAHSSLILPSNQRDGINKAVFIVDTSGSMLWMEGVMTKVANEVQGAIEAGVISEAIVVYADTVVTRVDRYADGELVEFDPKGGGGTDMRPAFQWVEDNEPDATCIVCLTDLEIGNPGVEPVQPTLWAVYNDPRAIKLLTPPWGEVIDVGTGV
jgi:predicted metal-dependent peptidase